MLMFATIFYFNMLVFATCMQYQNTSLTSRYYLFNLDKNRAS